MGFDSFNLKYRFNKFCYKAKKLLPDFFYRSDRKKNPDTLLQKQIDLDKKLVYSMSKSRIPTPAQIKYVKTFLSKKELLTLKICSGVIIISFLFLGGRFYTKHLVSQPLEGGDYIEGVVGAPKYINPLYSSFSDVDSDLSQLVYSSLFKRDINGFLSKDLADEYTVSADGKSYVIKVRQGVYWHNGSELTANDIIFTFNAIKDGQYKSPLKASFSGVTVEKIDEQTIKFILNEPYAAFFELLIFGILPQELWYQLSPASASLAELNLKPIGSGPYKFSSLTKDKSGNIKSYTFLINDKYYAEKAHIKKIQFKFYPTYEELLGALKDNLVDGISYLPFQFKEQASNKTYLNYHKLNLPQLMAVFLNPKNPILEDKKVRQALASAIDKQALVDKVLSGDGRLIDSPILPDSFAYNSKLKKYDFNQAEARKLLESAGWKKLTVSQSDFDKAQTDKASTDEKIKQQAETIIALGVGDWYVKDDKFLIIRLTTVNSAENPQVAQEIKNYWEKIGVKTAVELIEPNQIQSEVIKPRNYEALFYGEMVGADPDPYLFWHSSQAGSAGLNLANYSNKQVDKLLEDARLATNMNQRKDLYGKFQEVLVEDEPAIFIYSPVYAYIQDKKVKNFNTKAIVAPSDRLSDISNWFIKTGKRIVW